MSRLIDKLLLHKFTGSDFGQAKKALKNSEVIVIDNVSRFFFEVSEKEQWKLTDYPSLAPPFETFFMEFKAPSIINSHGKITETPSRNRGMEIGCLFIVIDSNRLPSDLSEEMSYVHRKIKESSDIRWTFTCLPFISNQARILEPKCAWTFMVNTDGSVLLDEKGEPSFITAIDQDSVSRMAGFHNLPHEYAMQHFRDMAGFVLDPCLLALSFMHCKNVTIQRDSQSPTLAKAYQKKHGKPLSRYYTLDIEPMKKVLRTDGNSEKTGLKQALHICRGHFKNFSKGKGLFGKYKGLYWWDSMVRGSVSEGIVDKDYAVKSPKEPA